MASIKKVGEGFKITVSLGRDADGKQIMKYTTFHPQSKGEKTALKAAQAYAVKFEEACRKGEFFDEKITFEKCYELWKENYGKKFLSLSAYEHYCDEIERVILPEFRGRAIQQIRPLDMQKLLNKLEASGRSASTIHKYFTSMNSVFEYAYKMSILENNPIDRIKLPKIERDDKLHYFTEAQATTFLELLSIPYMTAYKAHESKSPTTGEIFSVNEYQAEHKPSMMLRAYFTLAVYSGARRGELTALTWDRIRFEDHMIDIFNGTAVTKEKGQIIKGTKTKAGKRSIKLPEECFSVLRSWKAEQKRSAAAVGNLWEGFTGDEYNRNFVFTQDNGKQMDLCTPSQAFRRILDRHNGSCEREEDKLPEIRLHDLRHTAATLLISNGADILTVSKRLGHASPVTTLNIYSHATAEKDQEASDLLESLFKRKA